MKEHLWAIMFIILMMLLAITAFMSGYAWVKAPTYIVIPENTPSYEKQPVPYY